MKIEINYLNFVFHTEVKTKSNSKFLNLVFQFIKNTKWLFAYTDSWYLRIKVKYFTVFYYFLINVWRFCNLEMTYFANLQKIN